MGDAGVCSACAGWVGAGREAFLGRDAESRWWLMLGWVGVEWKMGPKSGHSWGVHGKQGQDPAPVPDANPIPR